MNLFEILIFRMASWLFVIHAPQDPLGRQVSWRKPAHLIDSWMSHSENPKMSLSWPLRCGFSKRLCSKWYHFLATLWISINSIFNWLIFVTSTARKNYIKSQKNHNQIKAAESEVSLSNSKKSHLSVQTLTERGLTATVPCHQPLNMNPTPKKMW